MSEGRGINLHVRLCEPLIRAVQGPYEPFGSVNGSGPLPIRIGSDWGGP